MNHESAEIYITVIVLNAILAVLLKKLTIVSAHESIAILSSLDTVHEFLCLF